ncbi:MAG TPA: endopeptidase La [Aggregatilineales bacterium]|nr:endopeptidase La [Aggregatilineales bacterium]
MLGHSLNDFYNIRDARPDRSGLIEAVLVPLRDMVIFPNMVTPLFVARERTLTAIAAAQAREETVIGVAQRDSTDSDPLPDELYAIGTEMALGRLMRMPDGTTSVLSQGRRRVKVVEFLQIEPFFRVRARPITENNTHNLDVDAQMHTALQLFEKCVQLNRNMPEEAYIYALNVEEPGWLADLIASSLEITSEERQQVLEIINPAKRLHQVSVLLSHELDMLELEEKINNQVQQEVDRGQREVFLREQMRAIQNELGEGDIFQQELLDLRERIDKSGMPTEVRDKAVKELSRLMLMPPMAPEIGMVRTYLDWLLDLPWMDESVDNLDIDHAASVLDEEHFGLPRAKDRILEHIAVRKLAADKMRSPILCFVGPPGTGKTSLGRSIARALDREFVRVSLGGVRDEAEIRGHRRTYVGALPGRIIQTMRRAGKINPVFMLDEIDKLGQDFRGDPASALLEVLDPEQNVAYSDHYLDLNYDLSKVLFITTANTLETIPPALLDRLEVIEFSGYTEQEKLEIAKKFLIPRQLEQHGLSDRGLRFEDKAITAIIQEYTYEAGVRNLDREIANICRKIARRVAGGHKFGKRITAESLQGFLGPAKLLQDKSEEVDQPGIALGLAWTENGGDIMPIEVTLMPGKGNMTMTGQLGEVMQESVQAALSYTRSIARTLGIKESTFEKTDIHLHLPDGAIQKDGPSAGITLATALISAFTGRKVHSHLAMTGEITLRGRVLPVGGVKEKLLAAHRAGVQTIILPTRNEKDLSEIDKRVLGDLKIIKVNVMADVIASALKPAEPVVAKSRRAAAKPQSNSNPSDVAKPPRQRKPAGSVTVQGA